MQGLPTCCIDVLADWKSASVPLRGVDRFIRRLEAVRYSRVKTCATTLSTPQHSGEQAGAGSGSVEFLFHKFRFGSLSRSVAEIIASADKTSADHLGCCSGHSLRRR